MFNENLHPKLLDIYKEFDKYAKISGVNYSIDADYPDMQSYTISKCNDFDNFIRYILNYSKNKAINVSINGTKVTYNDLNNEKFRVPRRRNDLITFTLVPLQEKNNMNIQEGIKGTKDESGQTIINLDGDYKEVSDNLHKIANIISSEEINNAEAIISYNKTVRPKRKAKVAETVGIAEGSNQYKWSQNKRKRDLNPKNRSKINPTENPFEESDFNSRLEKALSEEVIGMVHPDVLMVKQNTPNMDSASPNDSESTLRALRDTINCCNKLVEDTTKLVENISDQNMVEYLNGVIDECNSLMQYCNDSVTEIENNKDF